MLQRHLLSTQSILSTGQGMLKIKIMILVFCWLQSNLEAQVESEKIKIVLQLKFI